MTRGDIFVVDFPDVGGHEQYGLRPAVVLQDDNYAGGLRTTLVVPLSAQSGTGRFPGVVAVPRSAGNGLPRDSFALVFQFRVVDRRRFRRRVGRLEPHTHAAILDALDRLVGRARPAAPSQPSGNP